MRTISQHFETDAGAEVEAELTYNFTPYLAATHLDPPEGGVEADGLTVDGHTVDSSVKPYSDWEERLVELAGEQESERESYD